MVFEGGDQGFCDNSTKASFLICMNMEGGGAKNTKIALNMKGWQTDDGIWTDYCNSVNHG